MILNKQTPAGALAGDSSVAFRVIHSVESGLVGDTGLIIAAEFDAVNEVGAGTKTLAIKAVGDVEVHGALAVDGPFEFAGSDLVLGDKQKIILGDSGQIIFHDGSSFREGDSAIYTYINDILLSNTTPISGWTAYTPTWTGSSGNPVIGNGIITGLWRRVGSDMEVQIYVYSGSTTTFGSGLYSWTIPSGYTIDTAKVLGFVIAVDESEVEGNGVVLQASTDRFDTRIVLDSANPTTSVGMWTHRTLSGSNPVYVNGNQRIGNGTPFIPSGAGHSWQMSFKVPISQWTTNINLVTDFTEYAYNTSTNATTSDITSFGYGTQGNSFGAITATLDRRIRFTRPVQMTDLIVSEVSADGLTWIPVSQVLSNESTYDIYPFQVQNGVYYGFGRLTKINPTDYNVAFGTYCQPSGTFGSVGVAWSIPNTAGAKWRVRKTSQGNFAEQTPAIIYFPRDTTSRVLVNAVAIPGSGFSGAIQATGVAGIPADAKAILVDVWYPSYVMSVSGNTQAIFFSDNNVSTPSSSTSHPFYRYDSYFSSAITTPPKELIIPLNVNGQFYTYNGGAGNMSSCNYSVVAKGYLTGGIST